MSAMTEPQIGQPVRVIIEGEIRDWYTGSEGKRHLVVQFETDRLRLLEFPEGTESVKVEVRDG